MIAVTLAVSGATAGHPQAAAAPQPKVARKHVERCGGAIRAVRFYRGVFTRWQGRMALTGPQDAILWRCKHLRRAAVAWREKANGARRAWHREFAWWEWLPGHWKRLAQCEEHLNWQHSDGQFEGAFAFATSTWDQYRLPSFAARAWQATPRQQYVVARRVAARLGIAGPWGCWRGSQHAWVRGGLPEYGIYR